MLKYSYFEKLSFNAKTMKEGENSEEFFVKDLYLNYASSEKLLLIMSNSSAEYALYTEI